MSRLKYLVIGVLALFLAGCGRGQEVVETLNIVEGPTASAAGNGKSIVILPFADYSEGNIASAQRRNMLVTEALNDRLIVNGFSLPIEEDVFAYLVKKNIISVGGSSADVNGSSLAVELNNDWSEPMKAEIRTYMHQLEKEKALTAENMTGTHGLDAQTVAQIGRQFKADYILRGRIIEFKTRQEPTWAIWKKGLIPFVNDGVGRLVLGYANSESYDDRIETMTARDTSNALTYGQGGENDGQSTVQIRMWVQEAATGNVVWSNRIRVLVSPESVQADNQYDNLFATAIDKSVTTLVDHFVAYGLY